MVPISDGRWIFALALGMLLATSTGSSVSAQGRCPHPNTCQEGCCPGFMCSGGKPGPDGGWIGGQCLAVPVTIPGPIPTNFAPGLVTIGNTTYTFVVDNRNNHVLYNQSVLGKAHGFFRPRADFYGVSFRLTY